MWESITGVRDFPRYRGKGEGYMTDKRKRRRKGRRGRRVQRHKRSVLAVSAVVFLLFVVVSAKSLSLREKEAQYKAQEMELEAQIREEKARAAKIEELGEYVGTDEYV